MKKEEWRKIIGFSDKYEISNFGRLRILDHVVNNGKGGSYIKKGRICKPSNSSIRKYKTNIYLMVVIQKKDGRMMTNYIHRLVAMAYVDNPYNKPHVNHKDGNTLNNVPENLEWVTNRENIQHAHDNGLINTPRGENTHKAKINNSEALKILSEKGRHEDIAKKYGVSKTIVWGIKSGKYWGSVTGIVYKQKKYYKNGHKFACGLAKNVL